MKPLYLLMFAALGAAMPAVAGEEAPAPQIVNVDDREGFSLDGVWRSIVDPYENGYYDYRRKPLSDKASYFADEDFDKDRTKLFEYNFNTDRTLLVPGDWNTQRPQLYYYEGTVWYRTLFNYRPRPDRRTFLYFGAANYETIVGLNGHKIGRHVGGYTPFNFEITDRVAEGENSLVVKVDNKRRADGVPTLNSDWWNYGGLTRSVRIVETPLTFIRDYFVQLKKGDNRTIAGWVQLDGEQAEQEVVVEIPELKIARRIRTDARGYASFEVKASPTCWSPENPRLYDVRIVAETDTVHDRIGFRTIETRGTKILLNGREIFCRGVAIHEEMPYATSGRAFSEEQDRILLGWAKEMGCNFVRLAHYPHNEAMVRAAEEMGLLVWSEIPVYWTIQWENPETYANAEAQLTDMIARDKNRANVVIWSVANETPHGEARLEFLRKLITRARTLDPTRLVSAAMEKTALEPGLLTVKDDLADLVDLISFNQYVGWYDGTSEKCDRVNWTFDIEKPVFISEFGGGAVYGRHGARTERFTEEYMEDLYERSVAMLERMPGLAGVTPWVLKDFRSPRRQMVGIQDDFNRKGLISDQGGRKKAFFVMQRWYEKLRKEYENR
ncbi:glycoside hydrolase family 2 protein [Alistipes sp.]|uniref:glycoside hydrolase family 2 protein n=1 Tax=Alistipes sp. TaxID=1872444 RepID=UPI003A843860